MQCKLTSCIESLLTTSGTTQISDLIISNANLINTQLRIEHDTNEIDVSDLICGNNNLRCASVTINSPKLKTMNRPLAYDSKLQNAAIDLKHQTKNLQDVADLFDICEELKTVTYYNTTLNGNNIIKDEHGEKQSLHSTKHTGKTSEYIYGKGVNLKELEVEFIDN